MDLYKAIGVIILLIFTLDIVSYTYTLQETKLSNFLGVKYERFVEKCCNPFSKEDISMLELVMNVTITLLITFIMVFNLYPILIIYFIYNKFGKSKNKS